MSEMPAPSKKSLETRERPRSRGLFVFRDFFATLLQPEFRPIFGSVVIVLTVGTLVFRWLEGWSLLDSLYFSVVTLATIGYGDLTPTTDTAKLFSIVYILVGVGILGVFISAVSRASMQRTLERNERLASQRAEAREKQLEHDL
jgi:voltage-gated potassium channel